MPKDATHPPAAGRGAARLDAALAAMAAEVEARETRVRRLFEAFPEAAFLMEPERLVILDCNAAAAALLGLPRKALIGRSASEFHAGPVEGLPMPEPGGAVVRIARRIRNARGEPCDVIISRTAVEVDGRILVYSLLLDVTRQRAAEAALGDAEERLRLALEGTDEGLWDWNMATGEAWFSDRWRTMLGFAPDEATPDVAGWRALVHPDDRARAEAVLAEHLEGQTALYASEHRLRHRDGRWLWVLDRGKVVRRDAEGRPLRAVGTHQDISRRKAAEDALTASEARLRHNEERFRHLVDTVADYAIVMLGSDGRIASWNLGAELLTGWTEAEAIGRPYGMLIPDCPSGQDRPAAALEAAQRDGVFREEGPRRRKDGSTLLAEATLTALLDPSGRPRGYAEVTRDITARRAAEAQFSNLQAGAMRASRLGAISAMAAGLAHELNQPLAAIANYAAAARLLLGPAGGGAAAEELDRARRNLEQAAAQAVRAGDIVRRLRDFVGRAEGELATIRVAGLIGTATADALAALTPAGDAVDAFELETKVAPDVGDVFGDAVQLQLVLQNLIRNAAEALRGSPVRRIVVGAQRAAGATEFFVADTGAGISAAVAPRLFEPFASGKPGGMGVGLAICRTVVEAHGGRIWADAPAGGGTTFRFVIPDAETTIAPDGEREA